MRNAIVALNERRLPGLRLRSKLHEGTRLWLSPGSPEEKAHAHKTLVRARCAAVLAALQKHECALIFSEAVDHVALNIPDYPEIVKRPMDLGTVKKKLEAGAYDERGPARSSPTRSSRSRIAPVQPARLGGAEDGRDHAQGVTREVGRARVLTKRDAREKNARGGLRRSAF